jgi:hypothetical protein
MAVPVPAQPQPGIPPAAPADAVPFDSVAADTAANPAPAPEAVRAGARQASEAPGEQAGRHVAAAVVTAAATPEADEPAPAVGIAGSPLSAAASSAVPFRPMSRDGTVSAGPASPPPAAPNPAADQPAPTASAPMPNPGGEADAAAIPVMSTAPQPAEGIRPPRISPQAGRAVPIEPAPPASDGEPVAMAGRATDVPLRPAEASVATAPVAGPQPGAGHDSGPGAQSPQAAVLPAGAMPVRQPSPAALHPVPTNLPAPDGVQPDGPQPVAVDAVRSSGDGPPAATTLSRAERPPMPPAGAQPPAVSGPVPAGPVATATADPVNRSVTATPMMPPATSPATPPNPVPAAPVVAAVAAAGAPRPVPAAGRPRDTVGAETPLATAVVAPDTAIATSAPLDGVPEGQPGPGLAEAGAANARRVAEAILLNAGRDRIELRLDPPELGRVEIDLTVTDGRLTATIAADRPETLDLLRRHADVLQRDLVAAGFGGADVGFSNGARSEARPEARPEAEGTPREPAHPLSSPPGGQRRQLGGADGRLDIRL